MDKNNLVTPFDLYSPQQVQGLFDTYGKVTPPYQFIGQSYEEGRHARKSGHTLEDNPYHETEIQYHYWRKGFLLT